MGLAISGLATGNDWESTISQLMAIDKVQITTWETRQKEYSTKKDIWDELNTKLLSLKTSSSTLTDVSQWKAKTTTSEDSTVVSASAEYYAVNGSYEIQVEQLAEAHKVRGSALASDWTAAADASFTLNGKTITVDAGDKLSDVVSAINSTSFADDKGVTATIVDNHLVLTAEETGSANAMTLTDTSGTLMADLGVITAPNTFTNEITAAQDATFTVDGITVTRSANTSIDDVITGVSLNLNGFSDYDVDTSTYASSTLTISSNTGSIATAVKGWVTNYNAVIDYIDKQTAVTMGDDGKVESTGYLVGDQLAMQIESRLSGVALGMYDDESSTYTSLASIGIKLGDYGTDDANHLVIDEAKLTKALEDDPEAVRALFAADTDGTTGYDTGVATLTKNYITPLTQYGGIIVDQEESL